MSGIIIAGALSVLLLGDGVEKEYVSISSSFNSTLESYLISNYGTIGNHNIQNLVSYTVNDDIDSKLEIDNININLPKLKIVADKISIHKLKTLKDSYGVTYPSMMELDVDGLVIGGATNTIAKTSLKIKSTDKAIEINGQVDTGDGLLMDIKIDVGSSEKNIAEGWSWLFYSVRQGEFLDTRWIKNILSDKSSKLNISISKPGIDDKLLIEMIDNRLSIKGSVSGVGEIDLQVKNLMKGVGAFSIINKDAIMEKMMLSIEHTLYLNKELDKWGRSEFFKMVDEKVDKKLADEGYTDPGYFNTTRGTLDVWTNLYLASLANKGRIYVEGEVITLTCGNAIMKNLLVNSGDTNLFNKDYEKCNRKWDQVVGMVEDRNKEIQTNENIINGKNLNKDVLSKMISNEEVGDTEIGKFLGRWGISRTNKLKFMLNPLKVRLALKDEGGPVGIKDIFVGSKTTNLHLDYKK